MRVTLRYTAGEQKGTYTINAADPERAKEIVSGFVAHFSTEPVTVEVLAVDDDPFSGLDE